MTTEGSRNNGLFDNDFRKYLHKFQAMPEIHKLPKNFALFKEGTKHDNGKPLIGDMIIDYKVQLLELCKVFEHGTKTYGLGNWKQVENGEERFTNAMIRHLLREDEVYDEETGLLHAAQVFFNAGARLYFILERMNKK